MVSVYPLFRCLVSGLAASLAFVSVAPRAHAQVPLPAPVTVLKDTGQTGEGLIFYTQQHGNDPANGPVIIDNQGRPVWYAPIQTPGATGDFRVQTYHGQPVLTWTQGIGFQNPTPHTGVDYIYDASYTKIAEVRAGNGLNSDLHEFQLTPEGTALLTIYHLVPRDLSALGGSAKGNVLESVIQEVDVATGAVLFEWHSLDHVGLEESHIGPSPEPTIPFDYFHINSIKRDLDGNLVVSARHTSALYKIDRQTGAVLWRLGGSRSDFTLQAGLSFGWQHHAVPVDATTIRFFDNEGAGPSRVLWVQRDEAAHTAWAARVFVHPSRLFGDAEGSVESLDNGNTFVGWGTAGAISEFDPAGNLIYDLRFPLGYATYRAYRQAWVGRPATAPSLFPYQDAAGTITVHAVWNGATEVATWRVLDYGQGGTPREVARVPWNGLDTVITLPPKSATALQVVALDRNGLPLGQSAVATSTLGEAPPVINEDPRSATVAAGDAVVMTIRAQDAASYQWLFDGKPLADGDAAGAQVSGATSPTLLLRGVTAANAGRYTCTVSNATASTTSLAGMLTVVTSDNAGRLVNLSCRSYVSGGENALTAGFVIGGGADGDTRNITVRASGPALAAFGVPDVLPDPLLSLYDPAHGSTPLLTVPSTRRPAQQPPGAAADAAGLDPRDAMLTQALAPAAYTATVTSPANATGVALLEVDDTTPAADATAAGATLINGSGRAMVGTGADILVAGFVIGGETARTMLVRAAGPTLTQYGVQRALADPKLELYSSDGQLIATNDDWAGDAQIAATAAAAGAFPWNDPASKDAALLITLPPGAYTAQVSGADTGTGVALVEVYEVK